jgi:hypothetical protein
VRKVRDGVYLCRQCDIEIVVPPGSDEPRTMIAANSGQPSERVVTVDGVEVHRCTLPPTR